MLEIWSKEQIAAKIPPEEFYRLGIFLSREPDPVGMNVVSKGSDDQPVSWTVEAYHWIPAESVRAVFKLVGPYSLYVEGFSDVDGIKLKQVFRRKKMIPVIDYVDLETINADPGVSTFGDA